ncbi:MAG TPA: hypothetical protein VK031_09975, partial [Tissierellaceae bacterium]|nr:hypothetical protein [Tissierellaceae bacterium]
MYGLYQIIYFTVIDILKTLLSPFFLVIVLIIFFQYKQVGDRPLRATIESILYGILGGIIATVSFIYLRIYIEPKDFMYILIFAIILSQINARFVCFSYGGSLLVLWHLITGYPKIRPYQIMTVVAILHIVESILIFLNGKAQTSSGYFKLNGKLTAGLLFNRFWPIPFVIFIGDVMIRPITLIGMLNYADFTISDYPRLKLIETGFTLFCYSSLLLIITVSSSNQYLPPIFALVGHEAIIYLSKIREKRRSGSQRPGIRGLRVMQVRKDSVAEEVGIRQGDII